jgi:2-polyprenyl-3-methyl-5-hydroxy-6-metoxy-1,4-benzoquinol methylase
MISAGLLKPFSWVTVPAKKLSNRFPGFNAAMWNIQYRLGMWDGIDATTGTQMIAVLDRHTAKPRILDLGCGKSINLPLITGNYRRYHGVDISASSIQAARKHARPNSTFEVADILRYETGEQYDAILLREVLYYLPKQKIAEFLRRITAFLEQDGKIFIQFWDESACVEYINMVRNSGFRVLEEQVQEGAGPKGTMIVLQPSGEFAAS